MKGEARISPIYRLGESPVSVDEIARFCRIEKLRREAWRQAGIVAVSPGELPEPLRSHLEAWARDIYGER